jgi:hypothetical protein
MLDCRAAAGGEEMDAVLESGSARVRARRVEGAHMANDLKPAAELAAEASKPYPNDSAEYRRARTALLAEEIELRRRIERVAARRPEARVSGRRMNRSRRARSEATCAR